MLLVVVPVGDLVEADAVVGGLTVFVDGMVIILWLIFTALAGPLILFEVLDFKDVVDSANEISADCTVFSVFDISVAEVFVVIAFLVVAEIEEAVVISASIGLDLKVVEDVLVFAVILVVELLVIVDVVVLFVVVLVVAVVVIVVDVVFDDDVVVVVFVAVVGYPQGDLF